MLKLMKYELRKNRTLLLVLLGVVVALEALFLVNAARKDANWLFVSVALLMLATYGVAMSVFIMGVSGYSRELNQKSSYLIFMTPRTPLQIIASKMIFTVLVGVIFALGLVALAGVDIPIMFKAIDESWDGYVNVINAVLGDTEWSVGRFLTTVAFYAALVMSELISTIAVAYLSITLSATFMRSRKGHALVSVLLFLAISYLIGRLNQGLVGDVVNTLRDAGDLIGALWPNLLVSLGTIAASIALSAWMLGRKVEL